MCARARDVRDGLVRSHFESGAVCQRRVPRHLFAVSVACAYVITPGSRDYPGDDPNHPELWGFSKSYSGDPSRSVALMPRYNAHFVPVRYCGRAHCVTGKSLPLDTDYQAAVEGAGASEALQRVCRTSRRR